MCKVKETGQESFVLNLLCVHIFCKSFVLSILHFHILCESFVPRCCIKDQPPCESRSAAHNSAVSRGSGFSIMNVALFLQVIPWLQCHTVILEPNNHLTNPVAPQSQRCGQKVGAWSTIIPQLLSSIPN